MKRLLFLMAMMSPMSLWAAEIGWSNPAALATYISQQNHWLLFLAFYGLGILLAFTPCVLPMVPILSGIIVGQNAKSAKQGFQLSLAYVAGMAITYAIAGMLAGWMGSTVQTLMQTPWVIITFSLMFLFLGFNLLDWVSLPIPGFSGANRRKTQNQKPKSLFSVAMMGVISTLVVSPCVTGPLIGILTYIGQSGQVAQGGLFLFILALGMGTPLLLVGCGYGKFLPKAGGWMLMIKKLFAYMMFALAIWLSSRILPATLTYMLYASLALIAGLTLGIFRQATHAVERAGQVVSVFLLMLSGILAFQLIQPISLQQTSQAAAPFIPVKKEQDLDRYLQTAKLAGQPVFIEFFAGWCSDCQAMDKNVFSLNRVQKAMANSLNLRVDISNNTPEVKELRKRFGILGIPTMLFVNSSGDLQQSLTAVGQVSSDIVVSNLDIINKR
ncbi:protein-disulfide reductase DsbD [Legionella sp. W05-934-2]|jgi:thiol:disulfide interchange protein DsbD|uniref:protein-disulfide reductase DsbD n=1 Tax=Legionella sp. W05-934-2 TaxID=1198649 RepID=UPI003461DDA9